ncbi:MAG TPA: hypothetical protein VMN78_13430 [Longimicrobiales bacterium]|nr:hypothetical protein [Longimicrobiales bacterium]
MSLTILLAYNQKPVSEDEPPGTGSRSDRYAEWDEPETIDAVASALAGAGRVVRVEANEAFAERVREVRPDIVFNIAEGLNGPNREAHIPAICEFLDVPYTGSDPLALCLGLDKRRAKEMFRARGVHTPDFVVLDTGTGFDVPGDFALPAIVKPLFEGSSMGIAEASVCDTAAAVAARARHVVEAYGQAALVERFLPGREFTVAVLGNGAGARALPIVEIAFHALPAGAVPIYGYEAKWVWDTTEEPLQIFECPAELDATLARAIEVEALAAFHALGCRDWGRVDLRLDKQGEPHVIEINPLPGILPDPRQNSCYPKAARAAGMSYDAMLIAVLDAALARHGIRR